MSYDPSLEKIYQQAEQKNSWFDLVSSPYLLFRWQYKHSSDKKTVMAIAKIASHRLGKHTWCESPENCQKVDEFIREHSWEPVQKQMGT